VGIPEVTNREWASPAPWAEVVARSRGRAKYNSIRRLRAWLRRLAIVRRLRHVGDIHQRGLQRQLAEELGVVRGVICADLKQIMAAGGLGMHADERQRGTGAGCRAHQAKEKTLSQRCTVRLPDALYEYLQIEADARRCGVSDLIRQGLERLLGLTSDRGAEPPRTPKAAPSSTPPPHDCVETVLARLPLDVREDILARARLLEMPTFQVLRALLIAQLPPSQPAPQVSGMGRPQTQFIRWQELNRQQQLGSALAPAAPTSGTSSSTTGART
jgi:hypothetical protein